MDSLAADIWDVRRLMNLAEAPDKGRTCHLHWNTFEHICGALLAYSALSEQRLFGMNVKISKHVPYGAMIFMSGDEIFTIRNLRSPTNDVTKETEPAHVQHN